MKSQGATDNDQHSARPAVYEQQDGTLAARLPNNLSTSLGEPVSLSLAMTPLPYLLDASLARKTGRGFEKLSIYPKKAVRSPRQTE